MSWVVVPRRLQIQLKLITLLLYAFLFFFLNLFIYFAVDWFFLKSINKRVIHTQNVTDIVYIVKL